MNWKKWATVGMTTFFAMTLVGCNSDETAENSVEMVSKKTGQSPTEQEQHEHDEAGKRFLVSSEDAVYVMNEKFEEVSHFNVGQGAFTLATNGRYVFTRDAKDMDSYTLIDSGLFTEDHGDHLHPYAESPAIAQEIKAVKPAHMISHAGKTAIFNDGNGQVDIFINEELSTKNFTPSYSYKGDAHHGAAVPLSTGELAVTIVNQPGDALPTGVVIVNEAGEQQHIITNSCEGLHGTAYGGEGKNEKLAFGCMGKAVVYDVTSQKTIDVALPDPKARIGTVKYVDGSDYFFTNYSIENTPQTKVGIIHAETAELTLVELPAAYKSALLLTEDNTAYVLAEDGNIYQIDLATATITKTITAFNPFDLAEESPILFEASEHVYAMMPSYQKIVEVHGDHTHEVAKLPFVPTALLPVETAH